MTLLVFVPDTGYDASISGVANIGEGVAFDVHAALAAGGGQITVDDLVSPGIARALKGFKGLRLSGSAPGPTPATADIIGPVIAHNGSDPQPGDMLVRGADELFTPQKVISAGQLPLSVETDIASGGAKPIDSTGIANGNVLAYDAASGHLKPTAPGTAANVVLGGASGIPAWAPATAYGVNQLVTNGGFTYVCKTAHTSGGAFSGIGANWAYVDGPAGASAFFGAIAFHPWDANANLGIGSALPNLTPGVGQNATSNIALGGGTTFGGQPTTGNLGQATTGFDNVAIGTPSMPELTTGQKNIGVGPDSLTRLTTGSNMVAIGAQALESATDNTGLVAVGSAALQAAVSGAATSAAVGHVALTKMTTGVQNTAVGYQALSTITTAGHCTAVGYNALWQATGGSNTAVGGAALASNTTGNSNTGVGQNAIGACSTGNQNTGIGLNALNGVTTGSSNVGVGQSAGLAVTASSSVTAVGTNAGNTGSTSNSNMTLIGAGTVGQAAGVVAIGIDSGGTSASATAANYFVHGTANHKHFIPGLPAADPHVVGQLWANAGVVTVSAG